GVGEHIDGRVGLRFQAMGLSTWQVHRQWRRAIGHRAFSSPSVSGSWVRLLGCSTTGRSTTHHWRGHLLAPWQSLALVSPRPARAARTDTRHGSMGWNGLAMVGQAWSTDPGWQDARLAPR